MRADAKHIPFHFTPLASPLDGTYSRTVEGLEWSSSFLRLELPLGDLTLRLTIFHGSEDRQPHRLREIPP